MGMLVTGEDEPEVIEPMAQHDPRDRNAKRTRVTPALLPPTHLLAAGDICRTGTRR